MISASTKGRRKADERRRQLQQQPVGGPLDAAWSLTVIDEARLLSTAPLALPTIPLQFTVDPDTSVPFVLDLAAAITRPNHPPFSLTRAMQNQRFLRVELRVSEIYQLISTLEIESKEELLDELMAIMSNVQREKHIQWDRQRDPLCENKPHYINTSVFFYCGEQRSTTYRCTVLSALVLYHIYRTPRRAIRVLLAGIGSILRSVNLPDADLDLIPKDPRTSTVYYNLQPITRKYIVCPTCHALYLWDGVPVKDLDEPLNKRCTFKPNEGWRDPICDTELWKAKKMPNNRTLYRPVKVFTYQPFKYWLGRMLSRPDIENHIESAPLTEPSPDGVADDIWTSPLPRSLVGHDGLSFFPPPASISCLLLSLSLDGFNPMSGKAASTQVSSTGIWLVLLNLPKHLRYLHQNIYNGGVIPGPHKPSSEEINSYLDLLMDELVELYESGFFYSQTFNHPLGRLFQMMLIPLVCDMLASRQVLGQAGAPTAHDFCTGCDIDKNDIDVVNLRDWTPKNLEHIKTWAERWKNATSLHEREHIFHSYSIRWSPLHRLSYWDSTKYAVVDAMHTLDLGLLQNHVRVLFAMTADSPSSGDGGDDIIVQPKNKLAASAEHLRAYRRCIKAITTNGPTLEADLMKYHRKILYTFCVENKIYTNSRAEVVTGTAWLLAHSITQWRAGPNYSIPQTDLVEIEDDSDSEGDADEPGDDNVQRNRLLANVAKALLATTATDTSENRRKLHSIATKNSYTNIADLLSIDWSRINIRRQGAKQQLRDIILTKLQDDVNGLYKTELQKLIPRFNTFQNPSAESSTQAEAVGTSNSEQPSTNVDVDKNLATVAKLLLATINNDTPTSIRKLNSAATKKIYIDMCERLSLDYLHIDLERRSAKQQLEALILGKLREDSSGKYEEILQNLLPPSTTSQRVILGKQIMQIVWSDMRATQIPTWVATVPPNWGTTERGKLSAAQWRVICTIHLPISLIHLWRHETGRLRVLLDHFMDLVRAVRIANMKTSSPSQIQAYNHYIFRYVSKITTIFPGENLKPTHHMALHLGDFLERMGPVHSYNSPYFERCINFFHHQNTNSHPGKIETTLLNASAHDANLRAVLEDDNEIRPIVLEMVEKMEKIKREDIRGYRLASILDPSLPTYTSSHGAKPYEFANPTLEVWCEYILEGSTIININAEEPVLSYRQIAVQGVCYGTTQHISRNSAIYFSDTPQLNAMCAMAEYDALKAAFIDLIFQPCRGEPQNFYMVIRELIPIDQANLDPFRRYGFAGGFLCRKDIHRLKIINVKQVKAHAALTTTTLGELGDVDHVLCVDRLMNIFATHEEDPVDGEVPVRDEHMDMS